MNKNIFLKDYKLFVEDSHLYLKLIYEYENDYGIHEFIIPKLDLEINTNFLPIISADSYLTANDISNYYIQRYSDKFFLSRGDVVAMKKGVPLKYENVPYICNTLKEKPKEMTISEIEKKLGYKIKVISES